MSEIIATLKSVRLDNERTIWIREPMASAMANDLIIFLDGELYRERVRATAILDGLKGVIADSWFVFVSMKSAEDRWIECPCHPPFAHFVVDELLPWLEARYARLKSIRRRTLIGLSYTGLAAAFIAKEYPDVFHNVISQSGSFWWNDCHLIERYRSLPRFSTRFYLDVGSREVHENVRHREDVLQVVSQVEGVRRFRDVLRAKGHVVRYEEFDGGHEFSAWATTLPGALKWALEAEGPPDDL